MQMTVEETTAFVQEIMTAFSVQTGLSGGQAPVRYLWTDAFAVCNFLELNRRTGDAAYGQLALALIGQVHNVLGRHRADDPRIGWISGLGEKEGKLHPTTGGLRIGKAQNERGPDEPMGERQEWDRDGQYFHYLTKWMHALGRTASAVADARYLTWAAELAGTAYDRFSYIPHPDGQRRMYWKMSIDLSRPLVSDMGQHDPLDGLVAFAEILAIARRLGETLPVDLASRMAGLKCICEGEPMATADPLGIGGLLTAANTLAQLTASGVAGYEDLLQAVLKQALPGLAYQVGKGNVLSLPMNHRLAFRELGLTIGLRAAVRTSGILAEKPEAFEQIASLEANLESILGYAHLIEHIEEFWIDPSKREGPNWRKHEDINRVMLATSLAPETFLSI